MLENFLFSINAVLPILLTILLGFLLRHFGFLNEAFFKAGDKLFYYFLFPCSLFCSMYSLDLSRDLSISFILFIFVGTTLHFLLSYASAKLLLPSGPKQSVSIMNSFRANTAFIGIPLATALGGTAGTAVMASTLIVAIPFFNIFTYLSFPQSQGKTRRQAVLSSFKMMFTSPLILSCLVGIACVLFRQLFLTDTSGVSQYLLRDKLPFLYKFIDSVGSIASTFALINIGGLLVIDRSGKADWREILFCCLWRMILAPTIFLFAALALHRTGLLWMSPAMFAAVLAHFGTPVSATGISIAAELGGDADLARVQLVDTTFLTIVTLPLFIMFLRSIGVF